jgi:hypothetical protein
MLRGSNSGILDANRTNIGQGACVLGSAGEHQAGSKAGDPQQEALAMLDKTRVNTFSHVKAGDTPWRSDGLRDFFFYRDLAWPKPPAGG